MEFFIYIDKPCRKKKATRSKMAALTGGSTKVSIRHLIFFSLYVFCLAWF